MPVGGPAIAAAPLPSAGEGTSWSEADWHWDPVAMTATARQLGGSPAATAALPSPGPLLPEPPSSSPTRADEGVHLNASDAAGVALPAAGTPGTSSGEGGGGAAAASARGRAKAKRGGTNSASSGPCLCQADDCGTDLRSHTYYHQRNKICAVHIKANAFLRRGQQLRFCQRCGHPHLLSEFDSGKHSCRKQLEKHNARRRKRQEQAAAAKAGAAADASPPADADAAPAPPRRQQAAKRSRRAAPAARGASGSLEPPSADAVDAFDAALAARLQGGADSWPSAGLQDESGGTDGGQPGCAPASAAGTARSQLASAARLPSDASLGAGAAVSATGSAPALPSGAPPAPVARAASPQLPLLDFELDLRPTPFEELFGQQAPLQLSDSGLADDLASWLNRNLAEEEAQLQQQQRASAAQQPAQLWQLVAGGDEPPGWGGPSSLQLAQGIMRGVAPQPHAQPTHYQHQQRYAPQPYPDSTLSELPPPSFLPHGPGGHPAAGLYAAASPTISTISVKLFGCTPAELPPNLRDQLRGWFDGAVGSLDGYLRPGCVHLTAQAVVNGAPAGDAAQLQDQPAAQQEGLPAPAVQPALQGVPEPAAAAEPAPAAEPEAATTTLQPPKSCCQRAAAADDDPVVAAATAAGEQPATAEVQPRQAAPASAPPPPAAALAPACCSRKRPAEGASEPAGGSDGAVRRVVDRMIQSGEALWRSKTMLVQAGSHVALVHQGRLRQTWGIGPTPSRAVPAILDVSPPLLLASQPAALRVSGLNMLQNDCRLLLRLQGRYVQPAAATCDSCTCSAPVHPGSGVGLAGQAAAAAAAASFEQRCCGCCVSKLQLAGLLPPTPLAGGALAAAPQPEAPGRNPTAATEQPPAAAAADCCKGAGAGAALGGGSARRMAAGPARVQSVRLHLPDQAQQGREQQEPLLPGLLHLDVQRVAFSAPRGARVLVVSSPAVHRELLNLRQQHGPEALPPALLDQLGLVHEWVGRPEKMQYQLVEATAASLLFWAVGRGLPATAELLLSVLQAAGGASAAAAAAVLRRALQPCCAGGEVAGTLSTMDALSQLHLSMQATSAAAMQRAAELACHDGLSLLHRAVQSQCSATLRAVLAWGEDAGMPWRCDLAGPAGITPLHLAALLPDAAAARHTVLLLLGRCAPGAEAWRCCCAADGQTPADFFRAAAQAACGAGGAAAGEALVAALETEVAVMAQLQQPRQQLALEPAAPPPPADPEHACREQQQQQQAAAAPLPAAGVEALLAGEQMQPSTPRKNPGCLCAPGCPCALLDSCACCGSDSDEDGGEGGAHPHPTCGSGSGKCCCCSADADSHLAGCAGCEAGGGAPAGGGGGGCCGGGGQTAAAAPAPRSCCGGK